MKFPKLPKLFEGHRPTFEPVLASSPVPVEPLIVVEPEPTLKRKAKRKSGEVQTREQVIALVGSKKFKNRDLIYNTLDGLFLKYDKHGTLFISGQSKGADSICQDWTESRGMQFKPYPVEKKEKSSDRSTRMAEAATAIVAFITRGDLKSGVWNTISQFRKMGKRLYVVLDEVGKGWDRTWKQ